MAREPSDTLEPTPEAVPHDDAVEAGERIQDADGIADSFDTEVENVFPEQRGEDRLGSDYTGGSMRRRRRVAPTSISSSRRVRRSPTTSTSRSAYC